MPFFKVNKNDNIHKTKFKISEDQTNIDKYRLAANNTEYHITPKLTLQSIIIPKYMIIRQLFHVKYSS